MKKVVSEVQRELDMEINKSIYKPVVCPGCGTTFYPRSTRQIYHNKKCGERYKRNLSKEFYPKPQPKELLVEPFVQGDIIFLPLTGKNVGKFAIVDNIPKNIYLGKYKFCCDGYGYPMTEYLDKMVHLHHLILGAPAEGMVVDHINNNRLDCRASNLRFISKGHNNYNKSSLRDDNSSGCTGVYFNGKKWYARISKSGKTYQLGHYNTYLEAVRARKKAEQEFYGESPHFYNKD